jgi:hypothetical protein
MELLVLNLENKTLNMLVTNLETKHNFHCKFPLINKGLWIVFIQCHKLVKN